MANPLKKTVSVGGALFLLMTMACGASSATSDSQQSTVKGAVELTLRRPNGEWIYLGDLRGKKTLLFMFATFDGLSQAALKPTAHYARVHPEYHVIGIAVQPDAEKLVDAYEHALSPPFPVTYEPGGTLSTADSPLGAIHSVPTFVALSAQGKEIGRSTGFPSELTLDRLMD